MSGWTVLRVTGAGVLLYAGHLERLRAAAPAFRSWAAAAPPGIYGLAATDGHLEVLPRPQSLLCDGLLAHLSTSPLDGVTGHVPKPRPPCVYDAVRRLGPATLLSSPDGRELWEAATAALLAWDGGLVLPPLDRPRVASLAEAALAPHARRRPLLADESTPILLVNAVGTTEPAVTGRAPFPAEVRRAVEDILSATARRP